MVSWLFKRTTFLAFAKTGSYNPTMPAPVEYLTQSEANTILKSSDSTRDLAILTLFFNTGIFLKELIDLKTDSIDWENKTIKIAGTRQRDIPLNNQTHEALARWSRERPDTPNNHFFITTKGEVKNLSDRAVDKIIRQAAARAKINNKVNAQILRNTFAVRLFKEEITLDKATAILGISDPQSINRYIQAAKQPTPKPTSPDELKHVETQSKMTGLVNKVFPTKPKIAKPISDIKGPINPDDVVIGREGTVEEIKTSLKKGQSVLLSGSLGIGKSHLLKYMAKTIGADAIYIPSPSPLKNLLTQICDKINPDWKKDVTSRAASREITDFIAKNRGDQQLILIIDDLNRLRTSDADLFLTLLKNFTVLGATEELTPKLKQLWWKFRQIELKPLSKDAAKKLIRYLTQNLSISDYELLENHILTIANGLPLSIVDMIQQLSRHGVVTREAIRQTYHEAGIHYRDWTPAVVVLWALIIMFRFIALGTHSFESYILAGFGMATVMVMRFFVFRGR